MRGCYRCLLSYFNQPDHALIDRRDPDAKAFLLRLAQSTLTPKPRHVGDWYAAFAAAGLPPPDTIPVVPGGVSAIHAWPSHRVVTHAAPVPPTMQAAANARAWDVVALPTNPADGVPPDLIRLLKGA